MTKTPPARTDELAAFVTSKVMNLQSQYMQGVSSAGGALAVLRRAIGSSPGADPMVWGHVLDGFPPALQGRSDEPSHAEWAAHAALTLFALHQQSQREPMHRSGVSFGRATRELGLKVGNEDAVLRRFHALSTASSIEEMMHHARGLITQFRSSRVPLDYGRLASDLAKFRNPRLAGGVRLAWGRDYYRVRPDDEAASEQATGQSKPGASEQLT